ALSRLPDHARAGCLRAFACTIAGVVVDYEHFVHRVQRGEVSNRGLDVRRLVIRRENDTHPPAQPHSTALLQSQASCWCCASFPCLASAPAGDSEGTIGTTVLLRPSETCSTESIQPDNWSDKGQST